MKRKLTVVLVSVLVLSGCATEEYAQYSAAQTNIANARSNSEIARYNALSVIAKEGDPTSKVAAVMALALGNGSNGTQSTIQAPATNQALQWASILVPGLTSIAGMRYQYLGNKAASDNAMALGISTNETFLGMAGQIQAPGAITNTTLSGTGTMGSGDYTITDDHTINTPISVIPPVVPPVVVVPDTVIAGPGL